MQLLKQSFAAWRAHGCARLAAALAFYTVLSLAPMLIVVVAVAGTALGPRAAEGALVHQLAGLVGEDAARLLQSLILSAHDRPASGALAGLIGVVTLVLGASGVFGELQADLNMIWQVETGQSGWRGMVRDRVFSFAMVLVMGALTILSLVASTALAAVVPGALVESLNFGISFLVITTMFAAIYKYLPDTRVAWGDVLTGALFTALVFVAGKTLLGFYLGRYAAASAFGPAASLVLLLMWLYYSAQLFLFGAEFTHVYARRRHQGA